MEFSMEILTNFGCSSWYLLNRAVIRDPYAYTKNGGDSDWLGTFKLADVLLTKSS